ncbi:hypothetical protein GUJ93_ZPchr0006g44536 [Zizania palustris]|uniref:Uncharacterized protein n=1 Tax=Zizania palustris TaxID=103762 RepID=A0A8J5T883_ZIZPA|nr:hypothetical protein GUJ93_ZPchr0006g44536 [Zizania palustris]
MNLVRILENDSSSIAIKIHETAVGQFVAGDGRALAGVCLEGTYSICNTIPNSLGEITDAEEMNHGFRLLPTKNTPSLVGLTTKDEAIRGPKSILYGESRKDHHLC